MVCYFDRSYLTKTLLQPTFKASANEVYVDNAIPMKGSITLIIPLVVKIALILIVSSCIRSALSSTKIVTLVPDAVSTRVMFREKLGRNFQIGAAHTAERHLNELTELLKVSRNGLGLLAQRFINQHARDCLVAPKRRKDAAS